MDLRVRNAGYGEKSGASGESRAFVLLETARLRCEGLLERIGRDEGLLAIHREIGMAGYETSDAFPVDLRAECLAQATARLLGEARLGFSPRLDDSVLHSPVPRPPAPDLSRTLATMFSETIAASDALAAELADREVEEEARDRLHLVHAHVMAACELLDERLTVLELQGAGFEA